MSNKKLRACIKELAEELGYSYGGFGYSNLEDGDLRRLERQVAALVSYLGVENTSEKYAYFKYEEKKEK